MKKSAKWEKTETNLKTIDQGQVRSIREIHLQKNDQEMIRPQQRQSVQRILPVVGHRVLCVIDQVVHRNINN